MKIAVCVHLYYVEMFQEITFYLDNFCDISYDLYFTIPQENKVFLPVLKGRYPHAKVIVTDNVGFDIYPFLCFLKEINLDYYDVVFKLHSKKDIPIEFSRNGVDLSGSKWRDYMFQALMGSQQRVKYVMRIMERHPHIGMVCAREVLLRGSAMIAQDIDLIKVEAAMQECKLLIREWEYVAGSIFAVRSKLLKPLKNRNYLKADFPPYFPRDWNGLPYCLERVFGCLVSAQGMVIGGLPPV
ncbi:rhamnan synthesis F family protein [Desulfitobacterium hafniense]|uniref:rhamnan synthesis F family protein n=1 Tax=Desulfitobacterium hafniense TaxID=49338 RepID=UPI0012FB2611|nr:rhamnan synthesis F family protein [Desulfitobacterium hafniense]